MGDKIEDLGFDFFVSRKWEYSKKVVGGRRRSWNEIVILVKS